MDTTATALPEGASNAALNEGFTPVSAQEHAPAEAVPQGVPLRDGAVATAAVPGKSVPLPRVKRTTQVQTFLTSLYEGAMGMVRTAATSAAVLICAALLVTGIVMVMMAFGASKGREADLRTSNQELQRQLAEERGRPWYSRLNKWW